MNKLFELRVVSAFLVCCWVVTAQAAEEQLFELSTSLPEIQPDIDRKKIKIPKIDDEYFEVGVDSGALVVEDFGSHLTYGAQLSIHATQSVFFKAKYGVSKVNDNVFRRIGLALFDDGSKDVQFYSLLLGWNVFPGEIYLGNFYTLNSTAYIQAGAGSIMIGEKNYFGISAGMGIRLIPVDWLSLNIEVIGTEYNSDVLGFEKVSHNFESTIGLNVFF